MKIKIGKYPYRLVCNIHTSYINRKYGFGKEPEVQNKFENFVEFVEEAVQHIYNVANTVYFDRRKQKVSIKIDTWDTWSMDHTLAPIILTMLKQLKETKHGSPHVNEDDVPINLRDTPEEAKAAGNGTTDKFWLRWDWIMDEMIWAFEQKTLDDWEEQYYEYKDVQEDPEDDETMFGIKLIWRDEAGRKLHHNRMANGFRLFGVYFESLWD